jgi:hypothetical protein
LFGFHPDRESGCCQRGEQSSAIGFIQRE